MDEQQVLAGPYCLDWRGRTLKFGGLVLKVKAACVAAAKLAALTEHEENQALRFPGSDAATAAARAAAQDRFEGDIVSGRWKWGGDLFQKWLAGPDGLLTLIMALLDAGGTPLTTADATELAREEPEALARIVALARWDVSNPKAKRPPELEKLAAAFAPKTSTPDSSATP